MSDKYRTVPYTVISEAARGSYGFVELSAEIRVSHFFKFKYFPDFSLL